MKKLVLLILCTFMSQSAMPMFAQQSVPPAEAAQAITSANQQGNLKAAGEIYHSTQKGLADSGRGCTCRSR